MRLYAALFIPLLVAALVGGFAFVGFETRSDARAPQDEPETASYDDPAVAVCEFTKLKGATPPPEMYRRTAAKIEGLRVTITYEVAPLNTRPQERSYSCDYELDDNDMFSLKITYSDRVTECRRIAEEVRETNLLEKIESGKMAKEQIEKYIEIFERCQRIIREEAIGAIAERLSDYVELSSLGIYPIDPGDTDLQP